VHHESSELSRSSSDTGRPSDVPIMTRVDAPAKVSGRARYSSDVERSGQLEAMILRSPHAHARVVSVDTTAAAALAGVHHVLASDDVADLTWYEEDAPFFSSEVRFVGDEVAAVAAVDRATAQRALELIEVTYEVLDHVTDFEVAATRDAWDDDLWDVAEAEVSERGSVATIDDAAFVVEGEFRTPTAIHNSMEAHGCVAQWIDDRLTVYASTQGVNDVREKIADVFELDHNQVRVVAEHVGGGFGAKQVPWKNTIIASILSRETGHAVRLVLDRRAESLAAGKRGATKQKLRIGADEAGNLIGIDLEAIVDGGAYRMAGEASDLSGPALHLYACPNVRTSMRTIYTHTGPAVAFRAPGYIEATFALESLMDELAEAVGVDPIELRRRNHTDIDQVEEKPWSSPEALLRSYEEVESVSDWSNTLSSSEGSQNGSSSNGAPSSGAASDAAPPGGAATGDASSADSEIAVGRGFAAHEWMAATAMPPGYAWIEMNSDGSIHAACSAQDIGTGTRTALTQIVAETLSTDPRRVRLTLGDTAAGPPAPASAGSTTMPTMAPAMRAAATDLRQRLLEAAAEHLDTDADALELAGEAIVNTRSGDELELVELMEELAPRVLRGQGERLETNDDVSVRTFGSAVADVEVDRRTGRVTVTRVVVAPDCGRIVNPLLAESQVIGGVTQGIGFALSEQQIIDHRLGVVLNPNLEDYLVPTASDSCEIVHAEVDVADHHANALGVKGIGELPMIPVPAAIANAVADAIGKRPRQLPLTPRAVIELMHEPSDESPNR